MSSKRGLGKGLGALLGEAPAHSEAAAAGAGGESFGGIVSPVGGSAPASPSASGGDTFGGIIAPAGITELAIDQLQRGAYQPRRRFDGAALEELAESIRRQGVLQPIVVRPVPGRQEGEGAPFEIVAGERRWRAAQLAQLHIVPVVVRELDDVTTLELSILENIQREDLSPLEEAHGYRRLIDEFGRKQAEVARMLGKSEGHVSNALRLLSLPKPVIAQLSKGQLSAGHARALTGAGDKAVPLADEVIARGLSVRQTENLVRKAAKGEALPGMDVLRDNVERRAAEAPKKDADTLALEQSLEARLGLKTEITQGRGESGRISFSYKTLDQLDELLGRLG